MMKNNKERCTVAYVDFSKAFDRISHHKLLYVLEHYKINKNVISWISNLLKDRVQQTLVDGNMSNITSVTSGVPQGSVLGPQLFSLYIESLLKLLSDKCNFHIYAYADDLKILSNNNDEVQKGLDLLQNWALDWDLLVQPNKSEHISFNKNYITTELKINNKIIPCKTNVRDLGIILTPDLKWSTQIQKVTSKSVRLIYTLLRSFQSQDPSFYVNLYKTHIRPIIEYNSTIWNPYLITEIKQLEKIQKRFTKRLCKKTNTKFSDYYDRLRLLKLETLEERRLKLDLITLFKILQDHIYIDFREDFFINLSTQQFNLRGHNQRLFISKFSGTIRQNFFTNRIIPLWNNLPETIVNSTNLEIFKSKLRNFNIYEIYSSKL